MAAAFKQSDVERAIKAAKKQGCEPTLVEISPDGRIVMHMGPSMKSAADLAREALEKAEAI